MVGKNITGNYEMNLSLSGSRASQQAKVFFAGNRKLPHIAYLAISPDGFEILRKSANHVMVWKKYSGDGKLSIRVRVPRKGNFFRFWVNDEEGWIRGPLGEWEDVYEPMENCLAIEVPEGMLIHSFTVTTLPWLQKVNKPVIQRGPEGSLYKQQIIPGAIPWNYRENPMRKEI